VSGDICPDRGAFIDQSLPASLDLCGSDGKLLVTLG